ncbi:MAG: ABC transporter ATP-binding protein [Acidobacteria bacterium]|nr:ABC transporter ATP-binding protein [Acidobacteriota bacterium]
MLEASSLTKEYATAAGLLRVLDSVSFTLQPGEAAAVMGPSGSGKSTLLYAIGGLEPPTSGVVRLGGRNPYELDPRGLATFRNQDIGFVFQDHCLLPQCTVLENVLIPTLVGDADETAPRRGRELLEQVGLSTRLDHRPSQLSGGERQRAALARALIRRPALILCDEPTGNLDADTAATVMSVLVDLQSRHNTITIVVTHSERVAERFAKRWVMKRGRLSVDS